jgi:hypothetical protein
MSNLTKMQGMLVETTQPNEIFPWIRPQSRWQLESRYHCQSNITISRCNFGSYLDPRPSQKHCSDDDGNTLTSSPRPAYSGGILALRKRLCNVVTMWAVPGQRESSRPKTATSVPSMVNFVAHRGYLAFRVLPAITSRMRLYIWLQYSVSTRATIQIPHQIWIHFPYWVPRVFRRRKTCHSEGN